MTRQRIQQGHPGRADTILDRCPGDVYARSVSWLDIAEQAFHQAHAALADVVRSTVMLTDIGNVAPQRSWSAGVITVP